MADTVYVVDVGQGLTTAALAASTYKYVAWGTGATQAAVGDTALETAAAPTTVTAETGTQSQVTTTVANDTYQVVATITAGGTLAITEVAILNQATISGASCYLHGTFSAINVGDGDSVQFTIKSKYDQA
jgi:hypothetical protein